MSSTNSNTTKSKERVPRQPMPEQDPKERAHNFNEVPLGYSEEAAVLEEVPPKLTYEDKQEWLIGLKGVSLSSDGMIPFRDTIDRAHESGVSYVVQPGGSIRDDDVIKACDDYGMVMAFSGVRLFHH